MASDYKRDRNAFPNGFRIKILQHEGTQAVSTVSTSEEC